VPGWFIEENAPAPVNYGDLVQMIDIVNNRAGDDRRNQLAALIVAISVGDVPNDSPKGPGSPATEARRKGGLKGGKARAKSLTPTTRHHIAVLAAKARWKKKS